MEDELIHRILRLYFLEPTYIEGYENTSKIFTAQGVFALKRFKGSDRAASTFLFHIQRLYQSGFSHFVPVYHTNDGRYLVKEEEDYYYLTPWIGKKNRGNDQQEQYSLLFKTLGQLHRATEDYKPQDKSIYEDHYEYLTATWQAEREYLESIIESYEKKWYMSPFELLFCSLYHQALRAHEFATKIIEDWYKEVEDSNEVRVVMNHGKPSIHHFVCDEQSVGYLLSLEHSYYASPTRDLVDFFKTSMNTYPLNVENRFQWWKSYQKEFPWNKDENLLFLAYLAYPKQVIDIVIQYESNESKVNQLTQVARLQKSFWLMNNIEYFITKVQEEEYAKELEKAQSELDNII